MSLFRVLRAALLALALPALTLVPGTCAWSAEAAGTAAQPAGNAIYRCDFENYEQAPKLKGASTELLTAGAHGGGKALRIECKSKCILTLGSVDIEPGRAYVVRLWMKGKGGAMRVKPVSATGADTAKSVDSPAANQPDWREYTFQFKADEPAHAASLDIRLPQGGDCIFDDITVEPVEGQGAAEPAAPGADEVFIEAEAGAPNGAVQVVASPLASGGQCIRWGRGGGSLEIKFKLGTAGAYGLWQRAFTSDCWRVEVDGQWAGNPAGYPGEWSWVPAPRPLRLAAGEHTLRYVSASPWGLLDRVWISGLCAGGAKRRPEETESKLVEEALARLAGPASAGEQARAEAARKALAAAGWKKDGRDYEGVSPHAPHLLNFEDEKEMGLPTAVLRVSPAGSDEHGDGSAEKPWKTFRKAVEALKPGVRLVAAAGIYDERCTVTNGGEPGRYVHLEAEQPGAVTLKGFDLEGPAASGTHIRGFRIGPAPEAGVALHGCVSHVTVDDCEIARCGGTVGASAGGTLVFRRIRGFDNRYGIALGTKEVSAPQGVLIEDCILDNNQTGGGENYDQNNTDGIGAEGFGHGLVLRRVRSSRHGDAGFDIKAAGTLFDSCVAYKNLHYGFKAWQPCRFRNCIAAWNNWAGLDGCFGDYDHCVVYGNNAAWKTEVKTDTPGRMTNSIVAQNQSLERKVYAAAAGGRNILFGNGNPEGEAQGLAGDSAAEPQFVKPSSAAADFRLQAGSPAAGAGKQRPEGAVQTDLAGNSRAGGGAATDLGAYAAGAKAAVPLISDEEWRARCGGEPAWKLTRIAPK